MTKLLKILALFVLPVAACHGAHDAPSPATTRQMPEGVVDAAAVITPSMLRETATRIASDEMRGRSPGTEGDRLAREYLAPRLEVAGFEPAFGKDGWEQPFSIVGMTTELPEQWAFRNTENEEISFRRWDEFMVATGVQQPVAVANADEMPTWYPGDEFEDERLAALAK